MFKIVSIIGARPQFVKAAVLSRIFLKNKNIEEVILHTGQHYDENMSSIFFDEMEIPQPKYNLGVNGLNHGAMTGQMLEKIEKLLILEKPDCVLVYGDTNSTLAGALAAKKLHIKVAHVEAGLRSFNMYMPEEVNRIITDRISDLLFCPTQIAFNNLMNEGYSNYSTEIIITGDIMYDAALFYKGKINKINTNKSSGYVLATIHRAENTDDPTKLLDILNSFELISKTITIIFLLHPRTKQKLLKMNYLFTNRKILFIEPVGYLQMLKYLENCTIVMTDSGGLQKEAYFFNKYCVTLREETEWRELVDLGYNSLTGTNVHKIIDAFNNYYLKPFIKTNNYLYGDGNAGEKIVAKLYSC